METRIQVGTRWIGDGEPCFIIAEAGSNHNGSIEQAKQLIDVAADGGADAVKFQVFRAEHVYPKSAGVSEYLKLPKPIYDIFADMEMPFDWLPELADYCRQKKLLFMASVFDEESCDQVDPYVALHKIASYEMTHVPLVRHVAKKGKPVIISTGTANLEEIKETVDAVHETGNNQILLMQCTASYPAPLESINARAITTLQSKYNVLTGLSDHSRDPLVAPLAAVSLGADVLEKHFTLSNELPGPDHRFALEPPELKLMVEKVRETEKVLGTGNKVIHPVEEELRRFARRSIFAVCDIASGETFTRNNIAVLRCGKLAGSLRPSEYPRILGTRAARNIRRESALQAADLA